MSNSLVEILIRVTTKATYRSLNACEVDPPAHLAFEIMSHSAYEAAKTTLAQTVQHGNRFHNYLNARPCRQTMRRRPINQQENTKQMVKKPPIAVRDRLLNWALNGQTDQSSLAIARALLYGATDEWQPFPNESITFPREPINLQCCVLLIEAVPEARDAFPILSASSQHWAELIADWDALTASLRQELAGDLHNKVQDKRDRLFETGYNTHHTRTLMGNALTRSIRHYQQLHRDQKTSPTAG